jgi:hypothetical protein
VILEFNLAKPSVLSEERFLSLIRKARQAALTLEGVYDLALYQAETDGERPVWQCRVDLDGFSDWICLQADPRFQQVWGEMRSLGVQILTEEHLERVV